MGRGASVVVVGGGPAGCAAAITCASAGIQTVLVERAAFPRDRPGETLHPGVEPLFAQLGMGVDVDAAGFLRHEGHSLAWGGPPRFVPYGAGADGAWRGYQAWRADLDTLLLRRARALGVEVMQPVRGARPLLNGPGVAGVRAGGAEIRARYVVDAAGGSHWLARAVRSRVIRMSPRLVATYGYASRDDGAEEVPALAADPDGWTWTAPVREGCWTWTRLRLDGAADDPRWRPAGLDPRRQARTRGADVTWRVMARPAGPGYFAAGDAAAVLDPASSHGVLRALMSGILAGHAIARVLGGAASEREAAAGYGRWLTQWFLHDARVLHGSYTALVRAGIWRSPAGGWLEKPFGEVAAASAVSGAGRSG